MIPTYFKAFGRRFFFVIGFAILLHSNLIFAEDVNFDGDWEGIIVTPGRADSEVKISVKGGAFAQYYKRNGEWNRMQSRNPYYKKFADILLVGWINQSNVWTENQMFSLSYMAPDRVKLVWTRHVTNRKEGKVDVWNHRGEGELVRKGGMGASPLGSSILGKTYEIQRLGTDKQDAFVDGGWRNGLECIEVKFAVAPDMKSKDMMLKAYFYDSAGELIYELDTPSQISDSNQETSTIPMNIDAGEKYTVFFAIPTRFHRGSKKWKRAVVVLGDRQQVVAKVYPKDEVSKFSFPEKGLLKLDGKK